MFCCCPVWVDKRLFLEYALWDRTTIRAASVAQPPEALVLYANRDIVISYSKNCEGPVGAASAGPFLQSRSF